MTIPCIHHYNCESPTGLTSRGVCRHCGAERMFQNFVGQEKDDIAPSVKQKAKRDAEHVAFELVACIICGAAFVPGRKNQVLCGAEDCQRTHGLLAWRKHEEKKKGARA